MNIAIIIVFNMNIITSFMNSFIYYKSVNAKCIKHEFYTTATQEIKQIIIDPLCDILL